MNITVEVDETVLNRAREVSRIGDASELVRRALESFSSRSEGSDTAPPLKVDAATQCVKDQEAAYRFLAAIGGSMPDAELPRRRRTEDFP